jgi:hypothetical protein
MARYSKSLLVVAIALAALVLAGCGSSSDETTAGKATETTSPAAPKANSSGLHGAFAKSCGAAAGGVAKIRATGISCAKGKKLATEWSAAENCTIPQGASRGSCRVGPTICLSTVSDRGVAVSCARPNQSVAFIARRSAARAG